MPLPGLLYGATPAPRAPARSTIGTEAADIDVERMPRVAYIAGTSWSGSTLLEQALAQLDGCVSLGESYWIWDPHWPDMTCECGREFRTCDFWQSVLVEAYGADCDALRADVYARARALWGHWVVPALTRSRAKVRVGAALAELGAELEPLYRAVQRVSGATTIVDASKSGLWGLTIARGAAIDLRVVHLVRDPMGYLASDGRRRAIPYPPGASRPPRPPWRSLLTWLLLQREADALRRAAPRGAVVLYEDLVRDAAAVATPVAELIGAGDDLTDVVRDETLVVHHRGHAIGGNPRRPEVGTTVIDPREAEAGPDELPWMLRRTLGAAAARRYDRYRRSVDAAAGIADPDADGAAAGGDPRATRGRDGRSPGSTPARARRPGASRRSTRSAGRTPAAPRA